MLAMAAGRLWRGGDGTAECACSRSCGRRAAAAAAATTAAAAISSVLLRQVLLEQRGTFSPDSVSFAEAKAFQF